MSAENKTITLEQVMAATMQKMPFVRELTMAEVEDCVDALRLVRDVLESKLVDLREHVKTCRKRECRDEAKEMYRYLRERKKRVTASANDLGLQLAGQRERLEMTIAARLEARNRNAEE